MDDFQSLATRTVGHACHYIATLEGRCITPSADGETLRRRLGGPLPERGEDPGRVVDLLAQAGEVGTVRSQSPRYFGFVVGGSLPVATAADWLVSTWDQNAQLFVMSPLAAVVEEIAADWLKAIFGVPASWSVGFVTGAQMATFTGLLAARRALLGHLGWDVESKGLVGAPPISVLIGEEAHRTVLSALRMLGLGTERVIRVPTDRQGRISLGELERRMCRVPEPCIICAQVGNVNTGAADPIGRIADLARLRGAWLHVDGAFGLWAAASRRHRWLCDGIERADSIATDAHKWLNVPYDSGVVLTAHVESHQGSLMLPARYLPTTPGERDPRAFTPDESRRARGVPIYAALRALGTNGLSALVERCCSLAREMAHALARHPLTSVLNEVVLNQVLVHFRPPGADDAAASEFTSRVIARVQSEGTCWAGGTQWRGRTAMRISVCNWSTTSADIERSAAAILAAADQALRDRSES